MFQKVPSPDCPGPGTAANSVPPHPFLLRTYFAKKEGRGVAFLIIAPSRFPRAHSIELSCCWRGALTKYLNKVSGERACLDDEEKLLAVMVSAC